MRSPVNRVIAKAPRRCLSTYEKKAGTVVPDLNDSHNVFIPDPTVGHSEQAASLPVVDLAVKDNIATTTLRTTVASGILENYKSPYDASIIEWLRQQRPLSIRKTNMDEFGMGSHSQHSHFGAVEHNHHSPGGSSGGSAVAVATGQAHLGIGTDTGGSIRLPASYTSIVGFKPSYGVVSRFGVVPYANSLDTVGFLTKDVSGVRHVFSEALMYEHVDPRDPTTVTSNSRLRMRRHVLNNGRMRYGAPRANSRLHIGFPIEYNVSEMAEEVRWAWQNTLDKLQMEGHKITLVSLPSTRHALSAYYVLAAAESASNLAKYDGVRYGTRPDNLAAHQDTLYARTRGSGFGSEVRRRILLGSYTLSSIAIDNHFIQAQRVRRTVQTDFDRVFAMPNPLKDEEQFNLSDMDETILLEDKLGPAQVDLLLCPTAPSMPPLQATVSRQDPVQSFTADIFTVPASLAGLPAITIPVPISDTYAGTTGIQIIGQYWDDQFVLQAAEVIEKTMGRSSYTIRQ